MGNTVHVESDMEQEIVGRLRDARATVRRSVVWAMGVGVIPVPILDAVGISAIQLRMLRQLGDLYNIRFSEHRARKLIAALVGGVGAVGLGIGITRSLLKIVPGLGHALGVIAVPIGAAALTHAIGVVFIQHFESGGTFLTFDPAKVRRHFRDEFEAAKKTVAI